MRAKTREAIDEALIAATEAESGLTILDEQKMATARNVAARRNNSSSSSDEGNAVAAGAATEEAEAAKKPDAEDTATDKSDEMDAEELRWPCPDDDPTPFAAYLSPGSAGSGALLTQRQERYLAKCVERGDKRAREILVNANLRLVTSIAKRYQNRGIAMEDLIQEGTLGLIHAVDKYDWRRGFRFSTYATHWIRQALGRAVENQGRTIRLPSHAIESLGKIKRTREMLSSRYDRPPTLGEIATAVNMPVDKVETLLEAETPEPMSLDAPAGESTTRLGDLLPAEDTASPSSRIFRRALKDEIRRALVHLTPREREVLVLRYGLSEDQDAPMTLEQVGKQLHLSRERARQIEAGALQKLRRTEIGGRLRETVLT